MNKMDRTWDNKFRKVVECNEKKCKNDKIKFLHKLSKYQKQFNAIGNKMDNNKISRKEFLKKEMEITKKLDKTKEKIRYVNCQLDKCYKKTHDMVLTGLNNLLKKHKDSYLLAKKYKKLFSHKISVKDLIAFDNAASAGKFS